MVATKKGLFVIAGIDHVVEEGHDREVILNAVEYYSIESGIWQVLSTQFSSKYQANLNVINDSFITEN